MADSCTMCKFYLPVTSLEEPRGWCRFEPPVLNSSVELGTLARYPTCLATYWCGKFTPA